MPFQKATKSQAKLRMAVTGPSGSGKTYTALTVGCGISPNVAVIDTERGSASKYAGIFSFDVLELTQFHPKAYIDAIKEAVEAGYDVLIIDSLSHAWSGQGGVLELVDRAAKRSQSNNSFAAWRDVTPLHNALVDTILSANIHIIATMRSKTEYVLEKDERGRTTPRKVGMAPVQRDGMEYEFDVVAEMDMDNNMIVSKSRVIGLTGAVIAQPTAELGELLHNWLNDGVEITLPKPVPVPTETPDELVWVDEYRNGDTPEPSAPQNLGELKQLVVVEKKWVKGGTQHWDNLMSLLQREGAITEDMLLNEDYPAMYAAIESHYTSKESA